MNDDHALEVVSRPPEYDAVDAKPCCKRLRALSGASSWCYLPSRHPGDCHGVSASESLSPIEYTKGRRK